MASRNYSLGNELISGSLQKNRFLSNNFGRSSKHKLGQPFIGFSSKEIALRTNHTKNRLGRLQAIVKEIKKCAPSNNGSTTKKVFNTNGKQKVGSSRCQSNPDETLQERMFRKELNRWKIILDRAGTDIYELDSENNVIPKLQIKVEPESSDEENIPPPSQVSRTGESAQIFRNTTPFTFLCAEGTYDVYIKEDNIGIREASAPEGTLLRTMKLERNE